MTLKQYNAMRLLADFADDHAEDVYGDESAEAIANMKRVHKAADTVRALIPNK